MTTLPALKADIDAQIQKLTAAMNAAAGTRPPNADQVLSVLQRASQQISGAANHPFGPDVGLEYNEDYDLALVQSAAATPDEPVTLARLTGRDLVGFQQYKDLDPRWLATLWNRITHATVQFPLASDPRDLLTTIPDEATVAIAGDWGTGNASSANIAQAIAAQKADYTIHLGDVYYSGTESEEAQKFVKMWPAGSRGTFTLNSNHEMYSGGHGYFGVALADPRLAGQKGHSYFALTNANWLVLGLDSAYAATRFYQQGALKDAEVLWIHSLLQSAVGLRSDGATKKVLVLTHHQGLEDDGTPSNPLWTQVTEALAGYSVWWYWGHIHNVAAFKPVSGPRPAQGKPGTIYGRLVGHGGIPYGADPQTPAMAWTEETKAGDPEIPERALNGFAVLKLDGGNITETFFDERGQQRYEIAY